MQAFFDLLLLLARFLRDEYPEALLFIIALLIWEVISLVPLLLKHLLEKTLKKRTSEVKAKKRTRKKRGDLS